MLELWNQIVADCSDIGSPDAMAAFGQVLMIDIMLAGDNAILVGALAAGLPAAQRKQVILIGIIAALVLRVVFALLVTQLMQIVGLILAGGLLLLWVSLRMYRELRHSDPAGGSPEMRRMSFTTCSAGAFAGDFFKKGLGFIFVLSSLRRSPNPP